MKERFILTPLPNSMWQVEDNESGATIKFREGLFNETHECTFGEDAEPDAQTLEKAMRELDDWMSMSHPDILGCSPVARCNAIWTLGREDYWKTLAGALNGVLVDFGEQNAAIHLFAEVEDYLKYSNEVQLNKAEQCNLLGSLSLLGDEEAWEVIEIVLAFWDMSEQKKIDDWARDLLWWPAWCPKELLCEEDDNDDEIEVHASDEFGLSDDEESACDDSDLSI